MLFFLLNNFVILGKESHIPYDTVRYDLNNLFHFFIIRCNIYLFLDINRYKVETTQTKTQEKIVYHFILDQKKPSIQSQMY